MQLRQELTARPARTATIALLLADAVVLAVVFWHASAEGWRLIGDPAITVLRGRDVLSSHTPLLGMPSGFSAWSDAADPFHPGPGALWLLAPTVLLGAGEGVVLVIAWAVATAATLTSAAAARRVAGWWAAAGAATMAIALQVGIIANPIWSPIPPVLAALPALALCFVAWVVIDGRASWWPGLILLAAVVAGADLAYATLVLPLVLLAAARTLRDVRRASTSGRDRPVTARTAWLSLAMLVAVCALPAIEAVRHGGGNLAELWAAARAPVPVAGADRALDGLRAVLVPDGLRILDFFTYNTPIVLAAVLTTTILWARRHRPGIPGLLGAIVVGGLAWTWFVMLAGQLLDGAILAAVLIVLAVRGARLARPGTRALLATTAAVVIGALLGQWQTPAAAGLRPMYLVPVHVATAMFWFTTSLLAARAAAAELEARTGAEPARAPAARVAAVCLLAATCALLVLARSGIGAADRYLQPTARGLGPVTRQLDRAVDDGAYTWRPLGGPDATSVAHGIALRSIPDGIVPHVDPGLDKYYGPDRRVDGSERGALYITIGPTGPPSEGARRVASWQAPDRASDAAVADLADRARAHGLEIEPGASSDQLGTLLAGFAGTTAPAGRPVDATYLRDLGEARRSDPQALATLPDVAVVELVAQGLVDDGWLSDDDRATITALRDGYRISVWEAEA